jgi:hypothetical protein
MLVYFEGRIVNIQCIAPFIPFLGANILHNTLFSNHPPSLTRVFP